MLALTRPFMDQLGAALGPMDLGIIHNRIDDLYVALVRLYYQFLAASNSARTRPLWDALNLWRDTFGFPEPIEQTTATIICAPQCRNPLRMMMIGAPLVKCA
jgi:hypothetical protein